MGRPFPSFAATALRILIAWLLVMQPMIGMHAAAQAANGPLAMELCRGAPAPADNVPAKTVNRSECCLACVPTAAPPPLQQTFAAPRLTFAAVPAARAENMTLRRADHSPHSA